LGFLIRELLDAGLLHEDVSTVWGPGLRNYAVEARLSEDGNVIRIPAPEQSGNEKVLVPVSRAFQPTGGLRLLTGNLGNAIIKVSAVKPQHRIIEAPAMVFHAQEELQQAFKEGRMNRDVVAVVRYQGPKANGMPELHKLTPALGVLQDRGYRVALVTDGRM